jgi:hypothetical protein
MGRPLKRKLDASRLYLGVLETLRPELAETIRLESELADQPVEIVVLGGMDPEHPAARRLIGEQRLGRIVVTGELDSAAMAAAGVLTDEIYALYRRATRDVADLNRGKLFREVLSELDPRLAESLELEIAFAGDDVELQFDVDDDVDAEPGVLNLAVGEESEVMRAAADATSHLFELLDDAMITVEARPETLWQRLIRWRRGARR